MNDLMCILIRQLDIDPSITLRALMDNRVFACEHSMTIKYQVI